MTWEPFASGVVDVLFFGGLIATIVGQIWLVMIIARGNAVAALLCLVIPFMYLFFVQENWDVAKPAALTWAAGIATLVAAGLLDLFVIFGLG